jgi:hypothetical protein
MTFKEKKVSKTELRWVIVLICFVSFFYLMYRISEKINRDNIYNRSVYLNAVIKGKEDCFSHSNCIIYSYTYKNKEYKDQITTVSFMDCKGISLTKGSELSIIIDSLSPENNIVDLEKICL